MRGIKNNQFDHEKGLSRRHEGTEMQEKEIGTVVVDSAVKLHRNLER